MQIFLRPNEISNELLTVEKKEEIIRDRVSIRAVSSGFYWLYLWASISICVLFDWRHSSPTATKFVRINLSFHVNFLKLCESHFARMDFIKFCEIFNYNFNVLKSDNWINTLIKPFNHQTAKCSANDKNGNVCISPKQQISESTSRARTRLTSIIPSNLTHVIDNLVRVGISTEIIDAFLLRILVFRVRH